MPTRDLLVFGAGGWLGRVFVEAAESRLIGAPGSRVVDVADERAVLRCVEALRPRCIVNLAAVNPGQGSRERMDSVNHDGARFVARAAERIGARLLHISSDVVLDGRDAPYADDAPPQPLSDYGRSKAAGETAVSRTLEDHLLVRTSLIYDTETIDRGTAGFASRLAHGESCGLFTDELRCPLPRRRLAAALLELTELQVRGLLNVAAPAPISRYDFGMALLRRFGVAGLERVEPTLSAELPTPRPLDLTLDVSRARALLRTPLLSVEDELARAGRLDDHLRP